MPRLAEARLDLGVALVVAALAGLCGLATGMLPALHALRRSPLEALHAGARGVAGNRVADRARRGLVVATTALAFLLLAGATLVVRSWNRVAAADTGLETAGRLTFGLGIPDGKYTTPEQTGAFVAAVVERLRTLPGVEHAAAAFGQPFGDFSYSITLTARDGVPFDPDANDAPSAEIRVVTPDWFAAMGVPLRQGRTFTAADRHGATPVVIASETAVRRLLGGGDALGRTLELGTSLSLGRGRIGGEVVGVVGDVRDQRLEEEPRPIVYFVHDQQPVGFVHLVLAAAPERLAALVEPARRAVAEIDPDVPVYRVRTLDELLAAVTASRAFVARLLSGFAVAATALAAVGLFGVLAAAVAERRRELAVRGALGATPRRLVASVVNRAAALFALGMALGALVGLPLRRVLESQLYELSASDPRALVSAAALLGAVALAAAWAPARRAGRVDPMAVLREE
jgi:putative ABC transport system permease protein